MVKSPLSQKKNPPTHRLALAESGKTPAACKPVSIAITINPNPKQNKYKIGLEFDRTCVVPTGAPASSPTQPKWAIGFTLSQNTGTAAKPTWVVLISITYNVDKQKDAAGAQSIVGNGLTDSQLKALKTQVVPALKAAAPNPTPAAMLAVDKAVSTMLQA